MNTASVHQPFIFSPSAASDSQPADQTRRDITQILRELADANRSEMSRSNYVRLLADRVMRSVAAEGVIIWWYHDSKDAYDVEHRLGIVTDSAWNAGERATHDRLLDEVASSRSPVIVPPTPGACCPDVPANPTHHPSAFVPLVIDAMAIRPIGWLEVFLNVGGDIATQRGTLRFLAQVADLAGEFLRGVQLRHQSHMLRCNEQIDRFAESLFRMTRTDLIERRWVDELAEMGNWARVGLCRLELNKVRLAAVGHIESIDQHGNAAAAIRGAAETDLGPTRNAAPEIVSHHLTNDEDGISPRLVFASTPRSLWRVVVCDRPESKVELDDLTQHRLRRLLRIGEQAWNAAKRLESVPGGRFWAARMTAESDMNTDEPVSLGYPIQRYPLIRYAIVTAVTIAIAMFPIPSTVLCRGMINPAKVESHHAPIDAAIETVHVVHGQAVSPNEPMLTLRSAELNDQRTTLLGRQAVLQQRRAQWKQSLVKTGSTGAENGDIDGREIDEEIASIQSQLAIIDQTQSGLTIRSRRAGTVDAWQIEQLTVGRPVRRGDSLIRVVDQQEGWVVDARVAQRRVGSVRDAMQSDTAMVKVVLDGEPGSPIMAKVDRFGPTTNDPVDGTPAILLRCQLDSTSQDQERLVSNLPARISISCGTTSLGWFLIEDMWSMAQTWIGMMR